MEKKHLKIAIGTPSTGVWYADFAMNLIRLIEGFHSNPVPGYESQELRVVHVRGSILPKQRLDIVKNAQEWNADYLLWLDSDHTFPAELLHKLLSAKKSVVGINCVTKMTPAGPTARIAPTKQFPYGAPSFSFRGKGLEKVWRLGTGVMLVDMKVFQATGLNIFEMKFREEIQSYQGEDWSMCEAFEKANFAIFVDHDLSLKVGHIGNLVYEHDLVPETAVKHLKMQRGQD